MLLNCKEPNSQQARSLASELEKKYGVSVLAVNCLELGQNEISDILSRVLFEFPLKEIRVDMPGWITSLDKNHWLRSSVFGEISSLASKLKKVNEIDEFSKKIDIANSSLVLQYGAAAQKNIASFSENALASVRTKDLGAIGDDLSKLVNELKDFDAEEEKKGFLGIFKKPVDALDQLKTKYTSAEKNVDKIVAALEAHQITLMKDVAMLDQMYALNEKYYKELSDERHTLISALAKAGMPMSGMYVQGNEWTWTKGPWPWEYEANV